LLATQTMTLSLCKSIRIRRSFRPYERSQNIRSFSSFHCSETRLVLQWNGILPAVKRKKHEDVFSKASGCPESGIKVT